MSTPEFPTEATVPSPLASWAQRAGGFLIDYAPIWIVQLLTSSRVFSALLGLAYLIYMGYLDGLVGQTPGKAIMGLRLVNEDGELIGTGGGIGRKVLHILDSLVCFLGWLLPLVDSKRQTIADKVMSTYVVSGVEKKPFAVNLWVPPQGGSAS